MIRQGADGARRATAFHNYFEKRPRDRIKNHTVGLSIEYLKPVSTCLYHLSSNCAWRLLD